MKEQLYAVVYGVLHGLIDRDSVSLMFRTKGIDESEMSEDEKEEVFLPVKMYFDIWLKTWFLESRKDRRYYLVNIP